jgi:threonine aldolase
MRQAGIIAAAGIVALDTMINRLADDHRNARFLAEGCARIDGLNVDLARVQTNMVVIDIRSLIADDTAFTSALKEKGILAGAIGKGKIRFVTHRGIEREHVEKALNAIKQVVAEFPGR